MTRLTAGGDPAVAEAHLMVSKNDHRSAGHAEDGEDARQIIQRLSGMWRRLGSPCRRRVTKCRRSSPPPRSQNQDRVRADNYDVLAKTMLPLRLQRRPPGPIGRRRHHLDDGSRGARSSRPRASGPPQVRAGSRDATERGDQLLGQVLVISGGAGGPGGIV